MNDIDRKGRILGSLLGFSIGGFAAILVVFFTVESWSTRSTLYVAAATALIVGTAANYLVRRYYANRAPRE